MLCRFEADIWKKCKCLENEETIIWKMFSRNMLINNACLCTMSKNKPLKCHYPTLGLSWKHGFEDTNGLQKNIFMNGAHEELQPFRHQDVYISSNREVKLKQPG